MVKSFDRFILENHQQSSYSDWEKGLIKAWGNLLYLGYHELPDQVSNLVPDQEFHQEFENYLHNSDENLDEWMSEVPPTYDGGARSLFDKNRLNHALASMAARTPAQQDTVAYRSSENHQHGWNSYSLSPNGVPGHGETRAFVIPKGFPVIWADGIADKDEIILNLSAEDLKNFQK